jgi:hypothetical protein
MEFFHMIFISEWILIYKYAIIQVAFIFLLT